MKFGGLKPGVSPSRVHASEERGSMISHGRLQVAEGKCATPRPDPTATRSVRSSLDVSLRRAERAACQHRRSSRLTGTYLYVVSSEGALLLDGVALDTS
jgi:hypothetical protein